MKYENKKTKLAEKIVELSNGKVNYKNTDFNNLTLRQVRTIFFNWFIRKNKIKKRDMIEFIMLCDFCDNPRARLVSLESWINKKEMENIFKGYKGMKK